MIRFDKICKSYGDRSLFSNLSFCVDEGEKCGFVGRNGSGKTTLFRIITKIEESDSGQIIMPKDYRLGYLDQHIRFSNDTIEKEVIESLPESEKNDIYKAEKILFGLGFQKKDMQRNPNEFSGGYQLRLNLTNVLLSKPSCLLLDEPTNYLDISSIKWLQKFLNSWRGEAIIISHDRSFLDSVITHTIGINRNKITKVKGDTEKFFDLILKQEQIHESTYNNLKKKREHLESFVKRFSAKASKASQAQSKKKAIEKLPTLEKLVDLHNLKFTFNEKIFFGKKILTAKDIFFSYENMQNLPEGKELIENFSLMVEKGQRIAIVGKNGYGKSTILKLLAGEINPKYGQITISSNVSIGYFGQTNINRLDFSKNVEEEISEANSNLKIGEVLSVCGLMMFSKDEANKKISILSGGEKSRVLLGKILASPCNLLLLDEPTNHLDIESIETLLEALEKFSGAIIIVTHSEMILRRLKLDKLIICDRSKMRHFLGNWDDFLEKETWLDDSFKNIKITKNLDQKKSEIRIIKEKKNKIKDIKKKISKIEREIIDIEKKLVIENTELIKAIQNKESFQIQKLSIEIANNSSKVDALFKELENLEALL